MKSTDVNRYKTETVCVQAGTRKDTTFNAVAVPIYATSTFAFEAPGKTKGYDYMRTAIRPETRAIWIETPSNPLLGLVDIAAICAVAREHGQLTIVDNTFMYR